MQRSEDPGADAGFVAEGNRLHRGGVGTENGDRSQRLARAVEDENRAAPRANGIRYLAKDRACRFFQRDSAAENLADRVEKIDLLVALGELVGRMLDFERGLDVLGYDRKEEVEQLIQNSARALARADGEPRGAWAGNGGHTELVTPNDELLGRRTPRQRRQVGGARGPRFGARGTGPLSVDPDRRLAVRGLAERLEASQEVAHVRFNVRRTVLPRRADSHSTRSMRVRIKKDRKSVV